MPCQSDMPFCIWLLRPQSKGSHRALFKALQEIKLPLLPFLHTLHSFQGGCLDRVYECKAYCPSWQHQGSLDRASIFAATSYKEFSFFQDSTIFLGLSKILSYPKTQTPPKRGWYLTVSCWLKKKWGWRKNQIALSLCWACMGEIENIQENNRFEYFLSALPFEQMKSQTRPGNEKCGLAGDFLSWERSVRGEAVDSPFKSTVASLERWAWKSL